VSELARSDVRRRGIWRAARGHDRRVPTRPPCPSPSRPPRRSRVGLVPASRLQVCRVRPLGEQRAPCSRDAGSPPGVGSPPGFAWHCPARDRDADRVSRARVCNRSLVHRQSQSRREIPPVGPDRLHSSRPSPKCHRLQCAVNRAAIRIVPALRSQPGRRCARSQATPGGRMPERRGHRDAARGSLAARIPPRDEAGHGRGRCTAARWNR
jgi:hypothetical protein